MTLAKLLIQNERSSETALPFIARMCLDSVSAWRDLTWKVEGSQIIVTQDFTLDRFNAATSNWLSWSDVQDLLGKIEDAADMVIYSPLEGEVAYDSDGCLNLEGMRACIELHDSTQWMIYSKIPIELSMILSAWCKNKDIVE